ncbi:Uma2 family endonuclease [Sorangium sp. So ce1389]|uniref:Uma2 family endonuclease n=1 Tax=Sorangium sp. So ce1389 TaxID=3133336 RepID=UPI003F60B3C7
MTPAERERLLVRILDALSDPRSAMAEGRPHHKAKVRAIDMLTLHFGSTGRVIYLAEELAVLYPGEEVFVPDILAVLDVPQPEDDPRMAWVVADEGRGLSMVLEVLHQGNRNKDLVANVERYARLGIPEYFVYDRLRQQVHGYRLPEPDAARYQRIVPQMGRHASSVLGLDLAVVGDRLQFFHGMAELFGSADLIGRLKGMMESLEARAEQAQAQAEQAQAQAEQAQAQAEQAMAGLREAILAALAMRQIPCLDEARARLLACQEPATLQRWLLRAMSAGSLDEIFAE